VTASAVRPSCLSLPGQTAPSGPVPDRVTAGSRALTYRRVQAEYRAALAMEDTTTARVHDERLRRLAEALVECGHAGLAGALQAEARSGALLLALLTAQDAVSVSQLPAAVVEYRECLAEVDQQVEHLR
jgi:hypothetical protein